MTRRKSAAPKPLRLCIHCGAPIAEQWPPYLVGHHSGRITGPYHAGCAEKFLILARQHKADGAEVTVEALGTWPTAREETLPW